MLNFQTVGNPQQPAIIFLHGFLGSGSDWLTITRELSDTFLCLLPDLPGHGRSAEILRNVSGFEYTAREVILLLNHLQLQEAALIGYSMGGRLALFTALNYPSRFSRLILEGVNPGLESEEDLQNRKLWEDEILSLLVRLSMVEFLNRWYKMPIFISVQNRPELLQRLIQSRVQNERQKVASTFTKLALSRQPNLWRKLVQLNIPSLLISGELDEKYVRIHSRICQKLPDCGHRVIKGAGHNVHLEQPDRFIDQIRKFLK